MAISSDKSDATASLNFAATDLRDRGAWGRGHHRSARTVLDQIEIQRAAKPVNRAVVIVDDQGDHGKMAHGFRRYPVRSSHQASVQTPSTTIRQTEKPKTGLESLTPVKP